MTQYELKQFANARNISKSQLDNFVERLQNLFNASYNDPDAIAEAKALRILHNHLDYHRLTPFCQTYVDPTASFAAPRTHYWRFTHHIHLDECITRGPDNVDLTTAIDRMGRNFNRAMQTMNENTQNNRRHDNDNRNPRSSNYNTSNQHSNTSTIAMLSATQSTTPINRSNNYRQCEQHSSNNQNSSNNNSSRNPPQSHSNSSRNQSERRENNNGNNKHTNNNNKNRSSNRKTTSDIQCPRVNNINDDERTDNKSYTPQSDQDERSDDQSETGNSSEHASSNGSECDSSNDSCNTICHSTPRNNQYFH